MSEQQQPKEYGEHQCVCHWSDDNNKPPCCRPHTSPIDCSICPNPSLRNEQFRSKLENQRKIYEARIAEEARKAREDVLEDAVEIINEVEQFIKKEAKLTMLQWNDVKEYFKKKRALLQAGDKE